MLASGHFLMVSGRSTSVGITLNDGEDVVVDASLLLLCSLEPVPVNFDLCGTLLEFVSFALMLMLEVGGLRVPMVPLPLASALALLAGLAG